MKTILKTGVAMAAFLVLAACETPPRDGSGVDGQDVYGENGNSYDGSGAGGYDEFVANVGDRVFFGTDSSAIGGEAQATLQRQAAWLKEYSNVDVIVEGHCDERGTREYNLALGERRANAARNYLVRLGVNASRITTVSYGKERPAVIGSGDGAWSQNRRGVTVLAR